MISTSTCGNCWEDVEVSDAVSLCGGRCGFSFCTSCAAKTYQLLGRKNFLHSRGGPQTCRGLQCDGCRAPTPLDVVQKLSSLLEHHRLLSDAGAETNEADGAETDLALLNTAVALRGCACAKTLITRCVEGSEQTGQHVLLRNEAGLSVRLCDGLMEEEELELSVLPDPADRELSALGLDDAELTRRAASDRAVASLTEADRKYAKVAKLVIEQQGGFDAAPQRRAPIHGCLDQLQVPDLGKISRLIVVPDAETGSRCVHAQLVEHTMDGACRALHGEANLAVPPAICFECTRTREKLNGIKRTVEALRQRYEDEKGNVDVQKSAFISQLKASKKLTRCPFCETPAIHTNACDHMQCVKSTCRKHFCRGCSLNKWLLDLGSQVEDRFVGREAFLRQPRNYGGTSADDVYQRHLYSASSCNPRQSCFNSEAQRHLHEGEEGAPRVHLARSCSLPCAPSDRRQASEPP